MRVTTWTEYSLIIVIHLARRGGPAVARSRRASWPRPNGSGAITSSRFCCGCAGPGLVESVRGARGGYFLAQEPDRHFRP